MSKQSKTTVLKEKKPVLPRMVKWVHLNVIPFIAKAIITLGFAYATVDLIGNIHQLPEQVQGGLAVILVAIVLSSAVKKK